MCGARARAGGGGGSRAIREGAGVQAHLAQGRESSGLDMAYIGARQEIYIDLYSGYKRTLPRDESATAVLIAT